MNHINGRRRFGPGSEFLGDSMHPVADEANSEASYARGLRSYYCDFRVSVPIPFGRRHFVRFVTGIERRNSNRLRVEMQTQPLRIAAIYWAITAFFFGNMAFSLICMLYLVKCWLGINILQTNSLFHPLYLLIF